MSTANGRDRPRGRDETRAAVLRATVELLADHGPSTLSVRRIAERANVNHALMHRHFGTKDELIREAMRELSQAVADEVREVAQDEQPTVVRAIEVLYRHTAYWRTLARVALDDPGLADESAAPTTELFTALVREHHGEKVAATASMMLGWMAFSDFVLSATVTDRSSVEAAIVKAISASLGR